MAGLLQPAFNHALTVWGKIDDPLEAVSVHLACGVWGALAAALFSTQTSVDLVYGAGVRDAGLFYGGGAGPLFAALIAVLTVIGPCPTRIPGLRCCCDLRRGRGVGVSRILSS